VAASLAPTLPGMSVELEATLERVEGSRLIMTCRAVNSLGDLVGEGGTTQVIVDRSELARRFALLRGRLAN
jgi:fluoroacetyl-CoA thioesterase